MVYVMVNWVAGAVALVALSNIFPGFRVVEFESSLLAAGTVALISATISLLFRGVGSVWGLAVSSVLLAFVNTFVYRMLALLIPGFAMRAFYPAIVGGVLLVVIHLASLRAMRSRRAAVESGSLIHL